MNMCYNENGVHPMNFENGIVAIPTVQVPREMITTNVCQVSLHFRDKADPQIHRQIAGMLIAAFTKRRSNEHETSHVPVQSIDQRAG